MNKNRIILIAGSLVSFIVVFFVMAFAMGLMKRGPGALLGALAGHRPAVAGVEDGGPAVEAAAAGDAGEHQAGDAGAAPRHTATAPHDAPAGRSTSPPPAATAGADDDFLTRAEALARIEEALQKRQEQMEEEKAHLLALQRELEATNARLDSLEDAAVQHLARVYSSMRPETAAEIMMRLPPNLQTAIVARMEDKSAGKVLGAMDPRAAARVSATIGSRKP